MRQTILLFTLIGCAMAQEPIRLMSSNRAQNITSKEILAYVVQFNRPQFSILAHDFFFRPVGVLPKAKFTFEPGEDNAPDFQDGRVLWVQFTDGSEWGSHDEGERYLLKNRKDVDAAITAVVDAYSNGGEKAFARALDENKDNVFMVHVYNAYKQAGLPAALEHLKGRLESAKKHDEMMAK